MWNGDHYPMEYPDREPTDFCRECWHGYGENSLHPDCSVRCACTPDRMIRQPWVEADRTDQGEQE